MTQLLPSGGIIAGSRSYSRQDGQKLGACAQSATKPKDTTNNTHTFSPLTGHVLHVPLHAPLGSTPSPDSAEHHHVRLPALVPIHRAHH
jgi:hypothetical protein